MSFSVLYRLIVSVVLLLCTCGHLVVWAGSCKEAKLCCPGRDSSCVVQKAPINAIIEDLSDKPCYCDHACLKLGDCCDDFKDACGVVDCKVSSWGPWSECDVTCGPGMMQRSRTVERPPLNGGKHCPGLLQKRGCQGVHCDHHAKIPIRETAMLLPASLSHSRRANETSDIRRNLRLRYPIDPEHDHEREYCVEFEVLKTSKACRKEPSFSTLREGERVCVRCESQALRKNLGWRCQGHGVEGRSTRWSALSAPHCHGKWIRLQRDATSPMKSDENDADQIADNLPEKKRQQQQPQCSTKACVAGNGPAFIFV